MKSLKTATIRLVRQSIQVLFREWVLGLSLVVAGIVAIGTVIFLVRPGYDDPRSRMYLSRIGQARKLRSSGEPFTVTAVQPQLRELTSMKLGEGLVQSEPILVPVIPMGRVKRVHVKVGDRVAKGQLLAEIDEEIARLKVDAARAAVNAAKEEFERIQIGSVYQLADERPEREEIRLEEREREFQIQQEMVESTLRLYEKGAAPRSELLERELAAAKAKLLFEESKWALKMAESGIEHSIEIARLTVEDCEIALAHREADLRNHKVYAPADGFIERSLLHEGEYNQDPGKPAFLIANGLWFNAHFDQTALGEMQVGDEADIHLAAFGGQTLKGRVESISPIVSYNLGGPENNRPIRPLGTGAPEWPATFGVQISLEPTHLPIVPGLTGFAKVISQRIELSVPRAAITSVSSRTAFVFLLQDGNYRPRKVTLGYETDGWVGIREGLDNSHVVIKEGHRILEPGDLIRVTNIHDLPDWNPFTDVFMSSQAEVPAQ